MTTDRLIDAIVIGAILYLVWELFLIPFTVKIIIFSLNPIVVDGKNIKDDDFYLSIRQRVKGKTKRKEFYFQTNYPVSVIPHFLQKYIVLKFLDTVNVKYHRLFIRMTYGDVRYMGKQQPREGVPS